MNAALAQETTQTDDVVTVMDSLGRRARQAASELVHATTDTKNAALLAAAQACAPERAT